ncbi:hypothetical protein BO86DRAFT_390872 [Aspergillus japonicus CBS 114.51]|uniref:Uncharacterized protein n=1 Tax=Aspergillus japonicus CBS 114.51 TaxID=1448312 RepID=A0A8T8WUW6_ASPJA|nr:hypothetical protein BO86DRAFT_390872 [Aspergillus japonicus CBS 114.51]RAH79637.1 hypothetical protein BO86DRAFT_390872 [Aspergillus japonicus CBS 114.51]
MTDTRTAFGGLLQGLHGVMAPIAMGMSGIALNATGVSKTTAVLTPIVRCWITCGIAMET